MKLQLLILTFFCAVLLYSQTPLQKTSDPLNFRVSQLQGTDSIVIWVFFKDKGESLAKINSPAEVISQKSLNRRKLRGSKAIEFSDLPVEQQYVDKIAGLGCTIRQTSKWFNGASVVVRKDKLQELDKLPFVKNIDIVYALKKGKPVTELLPFQKNSSVQQPESVNDTVYGNSYTQLHQIKVPEVHQLGYTGKGVTIAVFDAGFNRLTHECFTHLYDSSQIIATHDFVNHQTSVADGNGLQGTGVHGTQTLSCIAAYKKGKLVGAAYNAKFILAKTENTDSETPVEEDNWLAAVEWADSIGVDVISSSLGYDTFDSPYTSYTYLSMDGRTCRITLTAEMAARKGIVVVNSASNSGYDANHNTLGAPADADSIITAGSVDASGTRSSFSSVGNTIDGRVKPDVMAMGSSAAVANPNFDNQYSTNSGTSFSCPITAGAAALLLCAKPSLTPIEVRNALRSTASNASSPNREYGWGIINTLAALSLITDSSYKPPVSLPNSFTVYDAFPNPFNPSVTIRYDIPSAGLVKAGIYNVNGKLIATLVNGMQGTSPAPLVWNGRTALQQQAPSGTYFCRIEYGNAVITKKVLMVK